MSGLDLEIEKSVCLSYRNYAIQTGIKIWMFFYLPQLFEMTFQDRKYFSSSKVYIFFISQAKPNFKYCSYITKLQPLDAVQKEAVKFIGDSFLQNYCPLLIVEESVICLFSTVIFMIFVPEESTRGYFHMPSVTFQLQKA